MYSGNSISPWVSTLYSVAATIFLPLGLQYSSTFRKVSPISCDHRMKLLPRPKDFVHVHPTNDKCIDKKTPGLPWSLQDTFFFYFRKRAWSSPSFVQSKIGSFARTSMVNLRPVNTKIFARILRSSIIDEFIRLPVRRLEKCSLMYFPLQHEEISWQDNFWRAKFIQRPNDFNYIVTLHNEW